MRWKYLAVLILTGVIFIQVQAQNQNNRRENAYYEEMIGNLSNQLRLLQDENAKLSGTVYTLQQEIREMKQQMQGMRSEVEQARKMISEESEARQKQMGNIADKIQSAADAQARAQAEADARAKALAEAEAKRIQAEKEKQTQSQPQEEYDYVVVEAGDTLTAISRATNVSITRLKQVNGMKNDVIRVGQKLKIPRK